MGTYVHVEVVMRILASYNNIWTR